MIRLKDKAEAYRQNEGLKGGYVIFYYHEIAGWLLHLTDENAQSWTPGCIAYDANGNWWHTAGGNEYDGAERWEGEF